MPPPPARRRWCRARLIISRWSRPNCWNICQRLTKDLPLPLFLYNIPQMTKTPFALETVRSMMRLDRVMGVKDSSGDAGYLHALLDLARARPEWSVLVGDESLLTAAMRGGDTVASSAGPIFIRSSTCNGTKPPREATGRGRNNYRRKFPSWGRFIASEPASLASSRALSPPCLWLEFAGMAWRSRSCLTARRKKSGSAPCSRRSDCCRGWYD